MKPGSTLITGTGRYIPQQVKLNQDFLNHLFYDENENLIQSDGLEIVAKFKKITGIEERRYADSSIESSGMAAEAAKIALMDARCDPETIDQIIVAHNFGDVCSDTSQLNTVPSLASRVKNILGIKNPNCIPYDILFGCPGWLQGVIQADAFFKAGIAQKCLVIGSETLSRVADPHDRDSMIYADGAGACVLEAVTDTKKGILFSIAQSHCDEELGYLSMDKTYSPAIKTSAKYLKMKGRKVYEYALKHVPLAMKTCLDSTGIPVSQLKKLFIHQANEKMDEAIIRAFYLLYGVKDVPPFIMPMSIHKLGNSSVATIPTLLDLVRKGDMPEHQIQQGDILLFASVGAGMNINAFCYRA